MRLQPLLLSPKAGEKQQKQKQIWPFPIISQSILPLAAAKWIRPANWQSLMGKKL